MRIKTNPPEDPGDSLLVDFLIQISKEIRVKEGRQIDFQTITDFCNCGNTGGFVSSAEYVVYGGLSDAAALTQTIDCQIVAIT